MRVIHVRSAARYGAAIAGLLLASSILVPATQAAAKRGALKLEVTVEGEESWKRGSDWRRGTIKERFVSETAAFSESDLESYNTLAPDYAAKVQEQADKADARRRKVEAMQARHGINSNQTANPMAAMMADPARMMAMQQKAEACKEDEACLRKLAMEMMAGSGNAQQAQMMPQMQAIDAQCAQNKGKAYEACIEKAGKERSHPPAGMEDEDIPDLAEPEQRYRHYFPQSDCGGKAEASIDRQGKGQMADVAGMYDTKDFTRGSGPVAGLELNRLCLSTDIVVDEKARSFYMRAWVAPMIRTATFIHHPPDAPIEGTSEGTPTEGVAEWVSAQLHDAPFTGTRSTVLTTGSGDNQRKLNVTVKWSFTAP